MFVSSLMALTSFAKYKGSHLFVICENWVILNISIGLTALRYSSANICLLLVYYSIRIGFNMVLYGFIWFYMK